MTIRVRSHGESVVLHKARKHDYRIFYCEVVRQVYRLNIIIPQSRNRKDRPIRRLGWRIPITKTGKARHVPLSDGMVRLLHTVPRFPDCPFVVPNPKTLRPYVSIFNSWNTARTAAGLPEVRIHDLRHSFASFLVNAGRSLYEVQKILGHTQIRTTQRYAHLSQETLLTAANAAVDAAGIEFLPMPLVMATPRAVAQVKLMGAKEEPRS